MKEQIHEIRIRIDGLAKLIYNECNKPLLVVDDPFDLPDKMSMEEMIQEFKKSGPPIMYKPDTITIEPTYSFMMDCYKSLLLGKAWLGKVLAELGEDSPYRNDGDRKTVEDIEPTADTQHPHYALNGVGLTFWVDATYIEKIDWLREEIKGIADMYYKAFDEHFIVQNNDIPMHLVRHGNRGMDNLSEARFHLGFELQRLKESHE